MVYIFCKQSRGMSNFLHTRWDRISTDFTHVRVQENLSWVWARKIRPYDHHLASRSYDREGRDFLSHPHTNNGFFFLFTISPSLSMPNGDNMDGLFYPTPTLMMDSYSPTNCLSGDISTNCPTYYLFFAFCKGGNFNIHIWVWFGYFICLGREVRFYL